MTDIDRTTDLALDELRAQLETIDADDLSLARMRGAYRVATSEIPVRGRAPKRRRVVFAVAMAAAIAVTAGVALLPERSTTDGYGVGPQTAAAAELRAVGDIAGDQPWPNLAAGEYFHTYAWTFQPKVPATRDDPTPLESGLGDVPRSYERWTDRDGFGKGIEAQGAADLHRGLHRDPRTGRIVGFGNSSYLQPGLTVRQSLLHARGTNIMGWPSDGSEEFQRGWTRLGGRLEKSYDGSMSGPPSDDIPYGPKVSAGQMWGTTIDEIEALPTGGPELDVAIGRLIASRSTELEPFGPMPTGAFGITVASEARERGIERAIRLLGAAPLPPAARRAVFRWLADQPDAHLDGTVTDQAGREGTSITFESVYSKDVAERLVTARQLAHEARSAGVSKELLKGLAKPDVAWKSAAHHEYRRWRANIVFDGANSDLLQSYGYSVRRAQGQIPELMYPNRIGTTKRPPRVVVVQGIGEISSMGGMVWLARDRTASMEPKTLVCIEAPLACE